MLRYLSVNFSLLLGVSLSQRLSLLLFQAEKVPTDHRNLSDFDFKEIQINCYTFLFQRCDHLGFDIV